MNILKNLFQKKYTPRRVVGEISVFELNLEEWRKQPNLVDDARKLFETPTWKMIQQVLKNESPVNYQPINEGMNANKDLQTLGDIRGYHKALNNLEAFAKPSEESEPIEATFQPETPEKEQ